MVHAVSVVLNLLLMMAIAASFVCWFRLFRKRWGLSPRSFLESIVPSRPRERPFWKLADVLVMLGSMELVSQLVMLWMDSQGWFDRTSDHHTQFAQNNATSIGGVSAIVIVLLWSRLFATDAPRKLGLTFSTEDVWLGLKAALLILPPVMLVSSAVGEVVEYEHPVLKMLAALPTPTVFVATFIATAFVTPLVEEFLVRVLLQGALQGLADRDTDEANTWTPQAFWPVVVTSLLFSLLHGGQGAAPIPLLFLSLGLGYLYRQTGSILAPTIVHMILNGLTLIATLLELHA